MGGSEKQAIVEDTDTLAAHLPPLRIIAASEDTGNMSGDSMWIGKMRGKESGRGRG